MPVNPLDARPIRANQLLGVRPHPGEDLQQHQRKEQLREQAGRKIQYNRQLGPNLDLSQDEDLDPPDLME
ncbi:hypothetical protein RRG08_023512 [Elysia crispata]|uniref:Uncharacterized protein n=1 Tax=Elysia crispata TaxID=231223 RepID=A0AAE0YY33_9GAST|nr:hypothetical protein RRG08_023512 [Elysia crispata]